MGVRSVRIRRRTGTICTVLRLDLWQSTFHEIREGAVSCSASELGSLLRALRPREARLGVPSGARADGTPLAHPHHLQVCLGVLGRRERLA